MYGRKGCIHFVGIGGCGLSVLAMLTLKQVNTNVMVAKNVDNRARKNKQKGKRISFPSSYSGKQKTNLSSHILGNKICHYILMKLEFGRPMLIGSNCVAGYECHYYKL